jgi:carbon-monoxide dehydrogenase large subunit
VPNWIMPGTKVPDRPVVAIDRVRFVGECVALVVAESQAMAHDAIALVDVDYETLAAVVDEEAAILEPGLGSETGTVFFAGNGGEYGTTVILDHGHDLRSLYGHLQETRVKQGEHIERGQIIALTGSTGRSSGPHLHYEIQVHGQAVDPRQFLSE